MFAVILHQGLFHNFDVVYWENDRGGHNVTGRRKI